MFFTSRYPVTLVLLLAVGALVACSGPAATGEAPEDEPTPTLTAETPESTVTAAPTETAEALETVTVTPVSEENRLSGSSWILTSFETGGEETLALPDSTVTLEFEAARQAGGNAGCNYYGSDYEVEENRLSFGLIESTVMACEDEALMDQEQRFLAALESADEFELAEEGNQLRITYGDGAAVLNFVSSASAPQATETPEAVESISISRLSMFGDGAGWATGRLGQDNNALLVLSTLDGGASWQNVTPQEAQIAEATGGPEVAASATFGSPQIAWVSFARVQTGAEGVATEEITPPVVWLTNDGGQSWQASDALALDEMPFEYFAPSDLSSTDGQFGWLLAHLGAGMSHDYIAIFTTENGGQTWQRVSDPETHSDIQVCAKSGLAFTDPDNGWLAGNCPGLMPPLFLYHTENGGATWEQTELPAPEGLAEPAGGGLGDRCGIPQIASSPPGGVSLMLRCFAFEEDTSDAWLYRAEGDSWQAHALPEPAGTFYFLTEDEGWYLATDESQPEGESRLYYTGDGGDTWTTIGQIAEQGEAQIYFADAVNGWIVAGYPPQRALFHSDDGGETWERLTPVVISR